MDAYKLMAEETNEHAAEIRRLKALEVPPPPPEPIVEPTLPPVPSYWDTLPVSAKFALPGGIAVVSGLLTGPEWALVSLGALAVAVAVGTFLYRLEQQRESDRE
ncbi:hypothetical protein ACFVRB_03480 [Streptomyces nojiriensis]|uniref:hypothetical protein n=1 Tax=Streptomyces nojiriensis TaxID=66374 RepID=UPI0036DC897C